MECAQMLNKLGNQGFPLAYKVLTPCHSVKRRQVKSVAHLLK